MKSMKLILLDKMPRQFQEKLLNFMELLFGKISVAHFNPAVTLGFLITKHITKIQLAYYLCAEIIGALLASLFVKYAIGCAKL